MEAIMSSLLFALMLACDDHSHDHDQDHDHDHSQIDLPDGDPAKGEDMFTQSAAAVMEQMVQEDMAGLYMLGMPDDHIADYIWNGKGNMPAFPDYSIKMWLISSHTLEYSRK